MAFGDYRLPSRPTSSGLSSTGKTTSPALDTPTGGGGTSSDPLYNLLAGHLRSLGLGALATVGADGQPGGWLYEQLQQGFDTTDELMLALQQTDIFRERFGVIVEQQRRAAAGQPGYVMTPADVIEYENRARQMMSAAGLPGWFYDQPEDFSSLILSNISPVELEQRITQGFEYVANAPAEVRAKFEEFYGVGQGDGALAAYMLDPNRTVASLERAKRTAYTSGMAQRYDINLSQSVAQRIAELPRSEAAIVDGLEQISRQAGLMQENLFETTDITADDAVAAVFEGDSDAVTKFERRQLQRSALNRSSTGGAVVTQQGVAGAGYASGR